MRFLFKAANDCTESSKSHQRITYSDIMISGILYSVSDGKPDYLIFSQMFTANDIRILVYIILYNGSPRISY